MPPVLTRPVLLLGSLALLLGLVLGLVSSGSHTVHRWDGPPGTVWAGVETRGLNHWAGRGAVVDCRTLELRCRHLPLLRTRAGVPLNMPDALWDGHIGWEAGAVVYAPGQERELVRAAAPG